MFSLSEFFTDPVLRAPTIGSMLMCLSAALVGVIAFVRRRSLIGEALSHATYPGIVLGIMVASAFLPLTEGIINGAAIVGGFISALLGLVMINRMRCPTDAALCFVLSLFLGTGVLLASKLQLSHSIWYRQIHVFLYGQVATMTTQFLSIYALLTAGVLISVVALFQRIKLCCFDLDHAKAVGAGVTLFRIVFQVLLTLSIVIGIRSVGVVMMAGMVIAPACAARQWTNRLSLIFVLAGMFGVLSAYFGCYLSAQIPRWVGTPISLATGPMIVLSAVFFALFSLLFAPKRGALFRVLRMRAFQKRCAAENLLKVFWKRARNRAVQKGELPFGKHLPALKRQGFAEKDHGRYRLTLAGKKYAARIVRIHRLWEVYLDRMGLTGDHVHRSASEMEHIITPDLEETLAKMLGDPKVDPHDQPIPQRGEY